MSKIGYIRVSTEDQNLARQEKLMRDLGVEKVFAEKVSGKSLERPELQKAMDYVREGDTLYVESISRFSRSLHDLFELMDELSKKGVAFYSDKEHFDTSTPQGRFQLGIFAALSQFERECMLERQAEGIAIAKAAGKYKGRARVKCDDDTFRRAVEAYKSRECTAAEAMRKCKLKPATWWRRLKEYDNQRDV
jgi:DNA invertase Pin-like site-specific DNA recombinase